MNSSALLQFAQVVKVTCTPESGALVWEGFIEPLLKYFEGTMPSSLSEIESGGGNAIATDRRRVHGEVSVLGLFRAPFQATGRLAIGQDIDWEYLYTRSPKTDYEIFIHCFRVSSSERAATSSVQALNSRLTLGMSEAHHRVKNTLQNVISYINVMLANNEGIDRESVQRLIRYIHSLASLHDVLLEEVKSQGDGKTVRLDRILEEVLAVNAHNKPIEWQPIPELLATPRRAATLSLIVNELLDNAHKFGDGTITLSVSLHTPGKAMLEISNTMATPRIEQPAKESRGLEVARLLAKADLQSELEISTDDTHHYARVCFPVLSGDSGLKTIN